MEPRLEEARVFDERVHTLGLDGRAIDAEVHLEWYSSEAQGVGGFLVVRDVTHELGALGAPGRPARRRPLPHPGRGRRARAASRPGSPRSRASTPPRARSTRCSSRRSSRPRSGSACSSSTAAWSAGTCSAATCQVSVKRQDGSKRVLQIRATGRRDTSGVVRHIDGVLSDPLREAEARAAPQPAEPSPGQGPDRQRLDRSSRTSCSARARSTCTPSTASCAASAPRSGPTQGGCRRRSRATSRPASTGSPPRRRARPRSRAACGARSPAARPWAPRSPRCSTRVATALRPVIAPASWFGGVPAPPASSPDDTHAPLVIDPGDAANLVVPERVQELGTALVYLALRAYRFAGSGSLRISAHRAARWPGRYGLRCGRARALGGRDGRRVLRRPVLRLRRSSRAAAPRGRPSASTC